MKSFSGQALALTAALMCICGIAAAQDAPESPAPLGDVLRAPSYPLVVHDPLFSIWSSTDNPGDAYTKHWAGQVSCITVMANVDGKSYMLMGKAPRELEEGELKTEVAILKPESIRVWATNTVYTYKADGVEIVMRFLSPILPDDLMILSRPVTYSTWTVKATDGNKHAVKIYYDSTAELAVRDVNQKVAWSRPACETMTVMKFWNVEQPILETAGDRHKIDWGYQFVAVPNQPDVQTVFAADDIARLQFYQTGTIPTKDDKKFPRQANDRWPMIVVRFSLNEVADQPIERRLMIAYDDEYSVNYLGMKLRPYWRKDGAEIMSVLNLADQQYEELVKRSLDFDAQLYADAAKVGGDKYAQLLSMTYRQAIGAHKLDVMPNGTPLFLSKENGSGGFIGTVDVLYPTTPVLALFNVELLKGTVTPIFEYVKTGRWKFPFAPHDLGRYPLALGQLYGGGEKTEVNQMPVEESGNMIITTALICHIEGSAEYAARYWDMLSQWAAFLKEKGFDPENQLCTDDFAGHLAHNVNLSAKAIVALACYARLCEMRGFTNDAEEYRAIAEKFVDQWIKAADDGDHFRLAFDKPGTWSMKYNIVWDKILGLNLFPKSVMEKEIAYYKAHQIRPYGLPLDNRSDYTKMDWEVWTATMADNQADFDAIMTPIYQFIDKTPDRLPMTDWYYCSNAKFRGFIARSVIGGVFIKMLEDKDVWEKWSRRGGK